MLPPIPTPDIALTDTVDDLLGNVTIAAGLRDLRRIPTGALRASLLGDGVDAAIAPGSRLYHRVHDETWVSDHGAVGDGTTDDTAAIAAAIEAVYASGGGRVNIAAGRYLISNEIVFPPNVDLIGSGADKTILYVMVGAKRILKPHASARSGRNRIGGITFWGFADRSALVNSSSIVDAGPFDELTIENCRICYSQNMAAHVDADRFVARYNLIEYSLRDGLHCSTLTSALVTGNIVRYCGDDAIALHIGPNYTAGAVDEDIVVSDNSVEKSFGIKVLGARRATIVGNNIRFCTGYGVYVGVDAVFSQGYATRFSAIVSNNTITDIINKIHVSPPSNFGAGIYISGGETLGTAPDAVAMPIGSYDPASGTFVLPEPYINRAGTTIPLEGCTGLVITGNIIRQTLGGLTHFSDSGFGSLWGPTGLLDPVFSTNIGLRGANAHNGIQLSGDLKDSIVSNNLLFGLTTAISLPGSAKLSRVTISSNSVKRCVNGISVATGSALHTSVQIINNTIDLDPYHEATGANGRTVPLDGSWAGTGGASYRAIDVVANLGATVVGNRISNALFNIATGGGNVSAVFNNIYEFDWSTAANKGIGVVRYEIGNTCLFRNCDPTSVNYDKYSTTADSGFVMSATSMPSSGYYRKGQFVLNSAPSISAGKVLAGWRRLTNGNGHVAGTDWTPVYEMTA